MTTPSTAFTSAGTIVAVCATPPATYDAAGFAALTFTAIGELVDAGTYGRKYNLVTHNPLATRGTVKRKGSYNDGAMQLKLARVPSDAGQAILITALDSDVSRSFKVTLQSGTIHYFTGQVLSYNTMIGTVDQITSTEVEVEIDNSIISVG